MLVTRIRVHLDDIAPIRQELPVYPSEFGGRHLDRNQAGIQRLIICEVGDKRPGRFRGHRDAILSQGDNLGV